MMPRDLEQAMARLGARADTAALPDAHELRGWGDRRRRRSAVAGAVAVVAVSASVAVGAAILAGGGRPIEPGPPTPTQSTPAATASAPARNVTAIPDEAFLQGEDVNGHVYGRNSGPVPSSGDMLPRLCGAEFGVVPEEVLVRRTMHLLWWGSTSGEGYVPDGTFDQTITSYRAGNGAVFMQKLRAAVAACPSEIRDGLTYSYRIVAATPVGDESVMIEMSYPERDYAEGTPTGRTEIRLTSAMRIGDVVMVLYEKGYEVTSSDPTLMQGHVDKAVSRLKAVLS
jgi:hypothetical protein